MEGAVPGPPQQGQGRGSWGGPADPRPSPVFQNGNITELLLREGFARCVDWSIAVYTRGADKLRAAERWGCHGHGDGEWGSHCSQLIPLPPLPPLIPPDPSAPS